MVCASYPLTSDRSSTSSPIPKLSFQARIMIHEGVVDRDTCYIVDALGVELPDLDHGP
jgi:hypothetical protein